MYSLDNLKIVLHRGVLQSVQDLDTGKFVAVRSLKIEAGVGLRASITLEIISEHVEVIGTPEASA